jgi:hypothetical protein
MSANPPEHPSDPFEQSVVYRMARNQLRDAAKYIDGIDPGIITRLEVPKRSMIVSVPVRMDDDSTKMFTGYRVQHSLTSGASKGGLRYAKTVDLGEVAALAMWMSWKCGIMGLPYSGAKGGIAVDTAAISAGEKQRLTRRFTEEVLSIIGPRIDVMAPDMGTDEQTMAWIYDTYSMKVGYACPEIVTGKPVELGGCVVGRTGFCIHPEPEVREVPKLGGTKDVDLAALRALAPTHVLMNIDENERETYEAIQASVPNVIVTQPRTTPWPPRCAKNCWPARAPTGTGGGCST